MNHPKSMFQLSGFHYRAQGHHTDDASKGLRIGVRRPSNAGALLGFRV